MTVRSSPSYDAQTLVSSGRHFQHTPFILLEPSFFQESRVEGMTQWWRTLLPCTYEAQGKTPSKPPSDNIKTKIPILSTEYKDAGCSLKCICVFSS